MEKFLYRFDPAITQDVMTRQQLPQTYSEALKRVLRAKVFMKRMYGQTSTSANTTSSSSTSTIVKQ